MLTVNDIKHKIDDFSLKIKDPEFIKKVINEAPTTFNRIFWSKDLTYSLEPLGLELVDVKHSKYLRVKPLTYTSLYEHRMIDDFIAQITITDKQQVQTNTIYYFKENDSIFEVDLDLNYGVYSISEVICVNGRIMESLKVDKNKGYWYASYIYIDDKIKQIHTRQYNNKSINTLGIHYVEYVDSVVTDIYHFVQGQRVTSYRYK
jgi:hypothetical protein